MESAFVRNAENGSLFSKEPVPFIRIPVEGECLFFGSKSWRIVQVIHAWRPPNNIPVIELRVSPLGSRAITEEIEGTVSPFSP